MVMRGLDSDYIRARVRGVAWRGVACVSLSFSLSLCLFLSLSLALCVCVSVCVCVCVCRAHTHVYTISVYACLPPSVCVRLFVCFSLRSISLSPPLIQPHNNHTHPHTSPPLKRTGATASACTCSSTPSASWASSSPTQSSGGALCCSWLLCVCFSS